MHRPHEKLASEIGCVNRSLRTIYFIVQYGIARWYYSFEEASIINNYGLVI